MSQPHQSTATAAQIILQRYHDLVTGLDDSLKGLFPPMGTVDAVDIVTMISTFFSSSYGGDYRPTIRTILAIKGVAVSEDCLDANYPLIRSFLDFCIETVRRLE